MRSDLNSVPVVLHSSNPCFQFPPQNQMDSSKSFVADDPSNSQKTFLEERTGFRSRHLAGPCSQSHSCFVSCRESFVDAADGLQLQLAKKFVDHLTVVSSSKNCNRFCGN